MLGSSLQLRSLSNPSEAGNRGSTHVVAAGEFIERRALRAPSGGLFLLFRCQGRMPAHVLSLGLGAAPALGCAGGDHITLHVGETSEYREHQAPGARAGVGPWLGE